MIKFSIVIPYYNNSSTLKRCLNSIYSQSFSNFEVIIINDGSAIEEKNSALNIVSGFPQNNLRFITQKNKGVSSARNTGIKVSKGAYLIFVDADDFVKKSLLSKISECISKHPNSEMIRYNGIRIDSNKKVLGNFTFPRCTEDSYEQVLTKLMNETARIFGLIWLIAFKRSFVIKNKLKFKFNRYHEDYLFFYKSIIKSKNFTSINYVGYYYYQNPTGIIRNINYSITRKKCFDMLCNYKTLRSVYTKGVRNTKLLAKLIDFFKLQTVRKIKYLNKKDKTIFLKKLKKMKINFIDYKCI